MHKGSSSVQQKICLIYLWAVPVVTALIGFGIGHTSYTIYLSFWAFNVLLMMSAAYHLGARKLYLSHSAGRELLITVALLCMPWLLFPVFAGMGPPPATLQGWLSNAVEQEIRYNILIAGGILLFLGASLLKMQLFDRGEKLFATMALAALSLAVPLFIINMAFWGYYLTDAFRIFNEHTDTKRPDWYLSIKILFYVISVVEVVLMYLASGFFAVALRRTGLIGATACRWYCGCSLLGIVLAITPPGWPEPLGTLSYLVAIPAIPFIMFYLIGVQLLRHPVIPHTGKMPD